MLRLQLPHRRPRSAQVANSAAGLLRCKAHVSSKQVLSKRQELRAKARMLGIDKEDAWMARGLGAHLGTIHYQPLEPCDQPVTGTTDFEFLCSYTWAATSLPGSKPTICVPGDAPHLVLHPLPKPVSIREVARKKVVNYRDANVAHFRSAPWRPMFRALEIMRPNLRLDDVDIIINRSALQALLRFGIYVHCLT